MVVLNGLTGHRETNSQKRQKSLPLFSRTFFVLPENHVVQKKNNNKKHRRFETMISIYFESRVHAVGNIFFLLPRKNDR